MNHPALLRSCTEMSASSQRPLTAVQTRGIGIKLDQRKEWRIDQDTAHGQRLKVCHPNQQRYYRYRCSSEEQPVFGRVIFVLRLVGEFLGASRFKEHSC